MGIFRLALFALIAALPAFSQAITAKVAGTVTDPSGAVVPNASVTIRSQQTNQARSAKTDAAGGYEFSFLPIGSYSLSVESAGFQKAEVASFPLSVDQEARIDVKMTIGQAAETVQVAASAIL